MPKTPQRGDFDKNVEEKLKLNRPQRPSESVQLTASGIFSAITGHKPGSSKSESVLEVPSGKKSSTSSDTFTVTSQDFSSNISNDEEGFVEKEPKVSYSEIASKDINTIGREINSLTQIKSSYEQIIDVSKAKILKIESKERAELFKGELENAKITVSMHTKNLEDVLRQLSEVTARYQKMKSGEVSRDSSQMDTENGSESWVSQVLLINEREDKYVLPFENTDNSPMAKLSQSLLHLLNVSLDKTASQVRFHTLEKKDYDEKIISLLEIYVDSLSKLLTGYFVEGKIPNDDVLDFLNMVSKKVLTDLRLDNFSRKKQKTEKRNFYIYLCLPKMNNIKEGNSQLIVDRTFAYFQRVLERLNEQQLTFIYETIRKQKKVRFTTYTKEQIRNVVSVDTLRTFRKFVLQSEWVTVLNVFNPDRDISLENKIVSSVSQRDLKVLFERERHNSLYRKHNIENIISFLGVRARELKGLFPQAQKGKKREGSPPLLEDVLKDNKLDPLDKIYRLDPLGLIFASYGFNSLRSPIKTGVLWNPQTQSFSFTEQDVQKLYFTFHNSLTDSERRKSSVNSLQEFADMLQVSLPIAQRITKEMLTRTGS